MDKLAGLFYGQGRYGIGPCASPSGNRTNSGFVLRALKWLACFFIVLGVAETALAAGVSLTINTPAPAEKASGGTFTVKGTAQYNGNCGNQIKIYTGGGCTGGSSSWQGSNFLCQSNSYSPTITMGVPASGACTVYYEVRDNIGGGQSGDAPRTNIVKFPQTITVTTAPPASKKGGESFPVAATASSGLPVSVTVSGNCSYTAPNVTMTKTTGTCTVTFSQAGNATWAAASAPNPYTVTATGDAQTITVTTPAPADAAYNSMFNVAATASSGRAVAITTSGSCSVNSGGSGNAVIKMTSGTGTCTVKYNQTDNTPPYAPAAEVTSATTATKLPQTISFPNQATPTRVYVSSSTFAIAPTATGGASGNAIDYSSLTSGICTVSGTTVTMQSGGDCIIAADQAGNANYTAASQATQTVQLTKATQSITVTQDAPGIKGNGQSFVVKAKAVPSGLPVSIQGMGACSGSGTSTDSNVTITMISAVGLCTVLYTQDGNGAYAAANPVTQYVQPSSSSGCLGEGTYTGLKMGSSGGYIGWACNAGDYIAPGHSISCSPPLYLPWIRPGWSIQPGPGFKGHVLQTSLNPGKTFRFQLAPGETQYYNVLNETDKTCLITGDAIYEYSGTRRGSNANAGYLTAIQDTRTMPRGEYCDYSKNLAQWKINDHGSYITLQAKSYPAIGGTGCIGSDVFGLSRRLLAPGNGNFGHWGDTWVRNAAPSCSGDGAKMTCQGYQPPLPDHVRFEFDASKASVCAPSNITIKVCANDMPDIGQSGNCTVFGGYSLLTPQSSRGTWAGLTAAPSTGFSGQSGGITLEHNVIGHTANLSYTNKSMNLANNTLECYDTGTNKRVSCTAALTFNKCEPFDAVEVGGKTAANPSTQLYTKLAGAAFSFDVVGMPSYIGNATIDLVDVSGGPACTNPDAPALPAAVPLMQLAGAVFTSPSVSTHSNTYAFVSADNGRKTFTVRYDNAAAKAAVRIVDKDGVCYQSSDTFSIRPAQLNLVVSAPAGGSTIAGTAFDMQVTAVNASSATTTNYVPNLASAPQQIAIDTRYTYDWHYKDAGGTVSDPPRMALADLPEASLTGNFSTEHNGVIRGTFQYNDIGKLYFIDYTVNSSSIRDIEFTNLSNDQDNGDCVEDSYAITPDPDADGKYGCNIGSTGGETVRFRPDHYAVTLSFSPACAAGSFSYMGQTPSAPPVVEIKAMSVNDKPMVRLFADYPQKASLAIYGKEGAELLPSTAAPAPVTDAPVNMDLTKTACFAAGAQPTDSRDASHCSPGSPVFDWPHASLNGVDQVVEGGIYANTASGKIAKTATQRSYDHFGLRVKIVDPEAPAGTLKIKCGADPVAVGDSCDSAETAYRYGVLKLDNAYGSELLPLYLNATAMYWNGTAWVKNTADSCTQLKVKVGGAAGDEANNNLVVGGPKGALSLNEIIIANEGVRTLAGGSVSIQFAPPGAGKYGSAEVALNLGDAAGAANICGGLTNPAVGQKFSATGANLDYLRGTWCNNTAGQDPHARINFGTAKTPILYKRLH